MNLHHVRVICRVELLQGIAKIHVGQQHASAAETGEAQGVQCHLFICAFTLEVKVCLVEIGDDLAARKASNGDDHFVFATISDLVALAEKNNAKT